MIADDTLDDLDRFGRAGCYRAPMLMLGAQGSAAGGFPTAEDYFAQWIGPDRYVTLDLDGGDLKLDLNQDLEGIAGMYSTVFNLGTLEHVWNAHAAWANALRAVTLGGTFVTCSPVGGWVGADGLMDHGVHQTLAEAIEAFVCKNGFEVREQWTVPFRSRGRVLRLWAVKTRHIDRLSDFEPVIQVYQDGVKRGCD